MDNTELHYLTYDPDEIMKEMLRAYVAEGGDVLRPGDEKDILLRAVLAVMVQAFAGIDNALRMETLRYAVRDYLDIIGEKRGCPRIEAEAAAAKATVTLSATGVSGTIAAGSIVTVDGVALYKLDEEIAVTGSAQTATVGITCTKAGVKGNALTEGDNMQFSVPVSGVVSVVCAQSASGGMDREEDESYRERIRKHMLVSVTTGPAKQYESAAKAVSSVILDAKALKVSAGSVGVYLILSTQTGAAALIQSVEDALNDYETRPLTDTVTVAQATEVTYTLNAEVTFDSAEVSLTTLQAAAAEYSAWQDNTIGRPFNPDKLKALLYQAGATLVEWGTGSAFDGGTVEYTEIADNERCKGTVTVTEAQ